MEINDKELFDSALSDTPNTEVETQAETPVVETAVNDGPVRDEQGRFAPKEAAAPEPVAAEPAPQVGTPAQPDNTANVPSWRLREVNDAKEAAERRAMESEARINAFERELAELRKQAQPKQEPVDFFTDPNAAFEQRLNPFETQFQALQSKLVLRASRAEAISEHGKPAVAEMEKALEDEFRAGNPRLRTLSADMRSSDDPIGVAMEWYRSNKLLKETGGDLTSYRTKLRDEALRDPEFRKQVIEVMKADASGLSPTQTQPTSVIQLPPSINRATSTASPHDEAGSMNDDAALFAHAIKR